MNQIVFICNPSVSAEPGWMGEVALGPGLTTITSGPAGQKHADRNCYCWEKTKEEAMGKAC